jgi:hypothetical protein
MTWLTGDYGLAGSSSEQRAQSTSRYGPLYRRVPSPIDWGAYETAGRLKW